MSDSGTLGQRRLQRIWQVVAPFLGLLFIVLVFLSYDLCDELYRYYIGGDRDVSLFELDKFPRIFAGTNLKLIATQMTVVALGALGMTLVIISGGIDLSPGSAIALITVAVALCLRDVELTFLGETAGGFVVTLLALLVGLGVGALVGFVNGSLITRFSIVPFIVTLGMMSAARGAAMLLSSEQKVVAPDTWLNELLYCDPTTPVWDLPEGFIVLVVLAIVVGLILRFSVFGRYIFAIGSNEATARLCGIRVERQKIYIYTLAGLFVGVAALMEFSVLGNGDPSGAMAKELEIIAAVVIGGGSLSGGKGSVLGSMIGALIIAVLRNGCDMYDISNSVQQIVIGVIIVAAVGVDQLQQRRRS